ncbi:choice-of-anchor D domain-containing protein [Halococcus sp. AFM35]|uniref:choice-of-anchor D domain-containing protein n=1 Tax=Halococcus sp. AFM35 TaxID=3421653 RepID=UPI003EC0CCE3
MSGHEKSRAVVLTALMVVSVFATGIAFTAGTVAADERTDDLNIDVQPDTVVPGSNTDTVIVEVTNGDAANETYQYTVTGPGSNVVTSGSSADDTFSFSINPQAEGDYTVEVTATGPNTESDDGASDTDTATVTSAYDLSIQPSEVPAGDDTVVINGQLTNDQGEGIQGQTLALRDTEAGEDDDDDSNNAILDASTSDANGQVSFQFTPDQSGRYPITNADGTITYENVTATPNELMVTANRTQLLVSKTDTTDFTVSANGEQLNGSELSNLDPSITQNGSDVTPSDGEYVDTNDDDNVDTYRVDIQPTASANAPVNATFSNSTFTGTTQIEVVTPNVQVNKTSPFTKGVRTSVELSATDPRDGSTINESSQFGIDIDGGTFEARSDEVTVDDTNGTTSGNNLELGDDEFAIISERTGADDDDVVNINATVFAYNQSAGTSEGTGDSTEERRDAFNQSVVTHIVAVAGDSAQPQQSSAAAATQPAETESLFNYAGLNPTDYTFEPLNADASPDTIPLSGESEVTVSTSNAQDDPLPRVVDLHTENYRSGNTGEDGQITFSVNPDQTGTITQNTFYDDEFVGSEAPYEVQTDTIEVTRGGDDGGEGGNIEAQSNQDFGDVTVGESSTETVTVENEGNGPVTVNETSISGADADEFEVVGGGADFTLQPQETQQIEVQFTPDSAGEKSGDLTIDTENDGTETVSLSGNGVEEEPGSITAPDSQAFGDVTVGESSDETVTVTNDGGSPVTVSGFGINVNQGSASEFSVVSSPGDDRSFTLAPGESADLGVRFTPDSTGPKSANLYVNTENDGSTTTSLTGSGVAETNTLRVEGGGEYAFYSFRTSGDIQADDPNREDRVRGITASGAVGGSGEDTYTFEGDLRNLYVFESATVYVNGEEVDPSNYESVVTVRGNGNYSSYNFELRNGAIQSSSGLSSEDEVSDNNQKASGAVGGTGFDRYRFNGVFEGLDRDGDALIVLNGQPVDPSLFYNTVQFSGDGSYSFTTSGEVKDTRGVTQEDSVGVNTASGAVGGGSDTYRYSGFINDISTDDGVTADGTEEDYE